MSSHFDPGSNTSDYPVPEAGRTGKAMRDDHLRLALQAAQLGAWEIDLRTNHVTTTGCTDALFGLDELSDERTTALYLSRVHPDDAEAVKRALDDAARQGGDHAVEFRVVLLDGRVRWLSSRGQVLKEGSGQPMTLIGVLTDISERKQAEGLLDESRQQMRGVLDGLFAFVGVMTPDGTLIEANQSAREAAHLKPEDVIGKPFWETYWWSYSPQVQAQLRQAHARSAQGERVRYDVTVRLGENLFIPIDFMLAPLRDDVGHVTHLIPSAVDISDRVEQQRRLQFQVDVLDQISDAVVVIDNSFRITYLNRAAAEQYLTTPEQALGTRLSDLYQYRWLKPEDEAASFAALEADGRWRGENIHVRCDGSEIYVESTVSQLRSDANEPIGLLAVIRDVTERKQAEQALREQERFLKTVMEAMPSVVYIFDVVERRNMIISSYALEALGYSNQEIVEAGANFQADVLHPDDREKMAAHFQHIAEAPIGSILRLEYRMRHRNGEWHWFSSRDTVFKRDAQGQVSQVLGIAQNITERKQAEEQLRESESRYRTLVDAIPQLVWSTRTDGYCDYVSQQWVDYTGVVAEDHYGDGWLNALHPDDREEAARVWGETVVGRAAYDLDYRVRRWDGRYRWFRVRGVPLRDEHGVITRWLGTCTDIHDSREAEEALRQSEARLRSVIANLPVVLFATNADGIYTLADGKALPLLGVTSEQVVGRSIYEVNRDSPQATENFRRVLVDGESIHVFRTVGSTTFESWASPLRDEHGQIVGMLGVSIDVTERARIEEERARLLEREQAARAEAEKANRLKTQFLGMVSHELRTPLTPIKGFVTTLMEDDLAIDPAMQRKFLGLIDQETDRLVGLVDQLLDVSRIQGGMLRINFLPCPLDYIVSIARVQLASLSAQHSLDIRLPPALPPVQADAERIVQVLVNLVGNAAKYVPPETTISISAALKDHLVQVDVADEGPGIPPEQRETVFQAFHQLETGGKRKGAGLGLAICKGIIEAHGGRIWIEANAPQGTRVCFTLRLAEG